MEICGGPTWTLNDIASSPYSCAPRLHAGACTRAESTSAGNPASTSPAVSPGNRRYKNLCISISPEDGTQPQPGTLMRAGNRYLILRIGRAERYPISADRFAVIWIAYGA